MTNEDTIVIPIFGSVSIAKPERGGCLFHFTPDCKKPPASMMKLRSRLSTSTGANLNINVLAESL
jgi:hypothetical protein